MQRRLHHEQPESFAFTPANLDWAQVQIGKYPEGRQASAVIPLLWRAQEQEGWVTRPAIEEVAKMLDMASIRVLEVATFYFMFQLQPVGSVAHIQICGTTSCMLCGAEDLVSVCKEKIAENPHQLSSDGKFSWEEVECLGACANAPMAQIGKDYYEDLTTESFSVLLDQFAAGAVPRPGPQNGRWASEPIGGVSSLFGDLGESANGSVHLATVIGETVKRIDGTEPTATTLMRSNGGAVASDSPLEPAYRPAPEKAETIDLVSESPIDPALSEKPEMLVEARGGDADDLKKIKGVGPKLEAKLHSLGVFHYDQIASWTATEIAWVDNELSFKGRIERDDWISQAKALANGNEVGNG
ncbi:MAG: NADH-quinone oxidoreductase subunit NuoE [Pseudomonadota bacterium]